MTDDDDRGESRRTIARRVRRQAGDHSARVARVLMQLPQSSLAKLGLDEELRAVVERSRKVTAQVARRRAERTLAGELRRIDLVELDARIESVKTTGAADSTVFHQAEQWRTRLLDQGISAVGDLPGGARDPLPLLIERAQRERATGKPPGAARALFRHIVAMLETKLRAAGAEDEEDDDEVPDDDPGDDPPIRSDG